MASVTKRPNGHYWIQFCYRSKRHTIRLGAVNASSARDFAAKIERLTCVSNSSGIVDRHLSEWAHSLDASIYDRLSQAGLVPERRAMTIGELVEHYWGTMRVKKSTRAAYGQVRRCLIECFGSSASIASITVGRAEDFRRWMEDSGLASATIGKRLKTARLIFAEAVKREWIRANPFDKAGWDATNPDRRCFVAAKTFCEVIAAAPDPEIRLVLALARWGGLRVPSEILPLRWSDVDWDRDTMRIASPKTERYAGKRDRTLPIFPEIRPHLDAVWDIAGESEYVISRKRITGAGYSKHLEVACRAAGVEMWPKPFINLRSTRETELMERFPIHVVCAWIGNSPRIAQKHYLQVTQEHLQRAIQGEAESEAPQSVSVEIEAKSEVTNHA